MSDKEILREKFSSQPDIYYRVELFTQLGFQRKQCTNCHMYFWTLETERTLCPDPTCQSYEFLGHPTPKRFDYVSAWRNVAEFFSKNGHQVIKRYPVVCRWRPDLYFTIASIVDFQRIESGKVVFEFPSNPLVVPQMCLRFLDVGNVGITGRHYTSFCMIGQQALANSEGYWKDRCIELVFQVLTKVFSVPEKEIVFREDVWLGPGAFGSCLDYYVRGLELGNAVFTQFEGTPSQYVEYREPVVDMGAGLERWAWMTNGTPTSYDVVFENPLEKLKPHLGDLFEEENRKSLQRYYRLAGSMDVEQIKGETAIPDGFLRRIEVSDDPDFRKKLKKLQSIYAILDHTRTLLFAISDGALPSNVGGGYNLRVVLRRALDFSKQLDFELDLAEVANWHAEQLKPMYPELLEHAEDFRKILQVESQKYEASRERGTRIVESLVKNKVSVGMEKLVELYESEGVLPESLLRARLVSDIPTDFYLKVTEKHEKQRHEETQQSTFDISGLSATNLIFYRNRDQFDFESKVLRILDNRYVILESTSFYPRGGGQEPDHGSINGLLVLDVVKLNNVVIHEIETITGQRIQVGQRVIGSVDARRRNLIMRHHTATHIVNGACRNVIGPWVFQHSAFKDENLGRLDITHFAHLPREQVLEIEQLANEIVEKNLPVSVEWIPRNLAEQEYGFKIYQGGVVPSKELRIVSIPSWDVEACGGTHCSRTGEVGLIKITKAERVQDGVERIEFVAGAKSVEYVERQEGVLLDSAAALHTPLFKVKESIANLIENESAARRSTKQLAKTLSEVMAKEIPERSITGPKGLLVYMSFPASSEEDLGQEYHTLLGEKVCEQEPKIIYVSFSNDGERSRIMAFCGRIAQDSGAKAGSLAKQIAKSLGGSGGGDAAFGQGGMPRIYKSSKEIQSMVLEFLKTMTTC